VPTPINENKQPDLKPLISATEAVGRILKTGDIVVYESTVYPGCTEEDCAPVLENCSGLKYIKTEEETFDDSKVTNFQNSQKKSATSEANGFYLAYSPERINPGDNKHNFTKIKKIVSSSTPETTNIVAEVYASVVEAGVYPVSSIKVAEAAKVIENAQRDLNIAFVNELALIFKQLDIDTNEVLEAAGTKWNFLPFRPGLVGGHCIGVDPYYLTHRAERAGYQPEIILAGRRINDGMAAFVAQQTIKKMAESGIAAVNSKVTILGLTFKEDCSDLRNSKVPEIISELKKYGCKTQTHDPYCDPEEALDEYGIILCKEKQLEPAQAVVLAVSHQSYLSWSIEHWLSLLVANGIVVDVKNVVPFKELEQANHRVWKL
jgi:UDP-N-acetyl-D-glucosamine/UDP-N-acetyl-D-galactosamine dehydrogenase